MGNVEVPTVRAARRPDWMSRYRVTLETCHMSDVDHLTNSPLTGYGRCAHAAQ